MTNRDAKVILRELVDKADSRHVYDKFLRGGRFDDPTRNAELVGKLVQGLPQEDRKLLETMSSDEILNVFSVNHLRQRPEKPITRVRGPVSLKK